MLLGIRSRSTIVLRHLCVAGLTVGLWYLFWMSRPEWHPEMRMWRAFGDASFMLLFMSMILGPAARIWPRLLALVPWRRELGIWFALSALVHGYLVWVGWARWDVWRFLGYEFIPQVGQRAFFYPGFGLANLMGAVALAGALPLAGTSSDMAVTFLGIASWKWLHSFAYVVFYLVALHGVYFLFLHYAPSFHRSVPPDPNWFRFYFLAMTVLVPAAQLSAFTRTVRARRRSGM